MTTPRTTLLGEYRDLLRSEPRARSYLLASLADDLGIAVVGWAALLLRTNLLTTQRERASLMLPALAAFLLGTIVSGPLADWVADRGVHALALYRFRVLIAGRAIETAFLGLLVAVLALGPPTVARILPYVVVSAFMKTALRATRNAFSVDLLQEERLQTDAEGRPMRDERGEPLVYKSHLFSFWSLTSALTTAAALGGLLIGGVMQRAFAAVPWVPFLIDVVTNVVFIVIVARGCRPADAPSGSPAPTRGPARASSPVRQAAHVVATFGRSVGEGVRFLAKPSQRPLLLLLAGAALVELVTEAYNGNMILKHLLGGTDDQVRYAEIGWTVLSLATSAVLPLLARRLGSLGKVFLATMLLDGLALVAAGAAAGTHRPLLIFTVALGVDRSLTMASTSLVGLAQSSASSARMRGRIDATFAFVVIVGDMVVEGLATVVSEAIGILPMVARVGALQIGIVLVIALVGGKRLWRFGLFSDASPPAEEITAAAPAVVSP